MLATAEWPRQVDVEDLLRPLSCWSRPLRPEPERSLKVALWQSSRIVLRKLAATEMLG